MGRIEIITEFIKICKESIWFRICNCNEYHFASEVTPMEYIAASGICLAAIIGSAWYENRRMKKEAHQLRETLRKLRQQF
jgi:hypothetical protein